MKPWHFFWLAGLVGVSSWVGYVLRMTKYGLDPSVAADAILMAGLLCFAGAIGLRKQKDKQ